MAKGIQAHPNVTDGVCVGGGGGQKESIWNLIRNR